MPVPSDTYALWNGKFNDAMKYVYAKGGVSKLYAADTPFLKTIGGMSNSPDIKQEGSGFIFPLKHNFSQGHSYHARGSGVLPFRPARPGKVKKATVTSTQHMHRITTDWESIERAGQSQTPDAAFANLASELMMEMRHGTLARVEESILYDGTSLASFTGGGGVTTPASVSNETIDGVVTSVLHIQVSYSSWALGLFLGKEGAPYDIYALTNGRPSGTRLNDNATVTLGDGSTTTPRPLILEAIGDVDTRELWFSGNATDLSDIATAINAGANDAYGLVYWDTVGNITNGLDWIITNGTASNYYGIDPTISLFYQGQTASNGDNQMTFARFNRLLNKLVVRGLSGANVKAIVSAGAGDGETAERLSFIDVWCHPTTYQDLTTTEQGQVQHNTPSIGQEATAGFTGIIMNTMLGPTRFHAYNRIKQGEMFVLPTALVSNIVGTSMPTLRNWGKSTSEADTQYFRQMEGVTGLEAAMYGNFGYFVDRPSYCLKITNIRNSDYA
jgi:hypothetical protein